MKVSDLFLFEDMHSDLDTRGFNPSKKKTVKVYSYDEFKKSLPKSTTGAKHTESKSGGTVTVAYMQHIKSGAYVVTGKFNHKDGYGVVVTESRMTVGDAAHQVANNLKDRYGYYTDDDPVVTVNSDGTASVAWEGPTDWAMNDPYWFHEELAADGMGGDYSENDYQPYYDEIPGFDIQPYNAYTVVIYKD